MTNDETTSIVLKCVARCRTLDQLKVLRDMHKDQPHIMRAIRKRKTEIQLGLM
jgi:hypothetical protein